jgi:hypothetical protein
MYPSSRYCSCLNNRRPVGNAAAATTTISSTERQARPYSLLDHFVTWFTNQISLVPNGIITIFKKLAPEFLGRRVPSSVSSRIARPVACVVGLVSAWPCINRFIGWWLITGVFNFFFYS